MLSNNFLVLLLFLGIFQFSKVQGKNFTVCEIVQELDNLHSIPRDEIYKHLCIVGSFIHTGKSYQGFLGMYRIGSEWWCGKNAPGGNCNVTCSDLLDDDIADDVACAQKIIESHGVQGGWGECLLNLQIIFALYFFCLLGTSEQSCKQNHEKKVKDCLETVDEFEDEAEWIFPTTTVQPVTTTFSTTTKFILPTSSAPLTSTKSLYLKKNEPIHDMIKEKHSIYSIENLFIAIAFIGVIAIIAIFIIRYYKVERFLRATFTDNVQLV